LGEAKQLKVKEIVTQLMEGISMNLSVDNQDKFMTNMSNFRTDLKSILDLNALYKAIIAYTAE